MRVARERVGEWVPSNHSQEQVEESHRLPPVHEGMWGKDSARIIIKWKCINNNIHCQEALHKHVKMCMHVQCIHVYELDRRCMV